MKLFRRVGGLFLALMLLLPAGQAAGRLVEPTLPAGAPLTILAAFTRHENANAQALADAQPWSFFACTVTEGADTDSGIGADFSLLLNGETVDGLWIMNGVCINEASYAFYGRPRMLSLTLHHQGGQSRYRFLMEDAFQPSRLDAAWQNGYQRLELPQALPGVTQIDGWIEDWYSGSGVQDTICISDIMVTGNGNPSYSIPPVTPSLPVATPLPSYPVLPQSGEAFTLSQKMATRSGPGTGFEEFGSFLQPGDSVILYSRYYNANDEIWWVQAEFTYRGVTRRVYTGAKRIREDISALPVEEALGSAVMIADAAPCFGPHSRYGMMEGKVYAGQKGTLWARENGYAQFEYFDQGLRKRRRVWIPEQSVRLEY